MARVIPGSIFNKAAGRPEARKAGYAARVDEALAKSWLSPQGIAQSIDIADILGGVAASGYEAYQDAAKRTEAIEASQPFRVARRRMGEAQRSAEAYERAKKASEPSLLDRLLSREPEYDEGVLGKRGDRYKRDREKIRQDYQANVRQAAAQRAAMAKMRETGKFVGEGGKLEEIKGVTPTTAENLGLAARAVSLSDRELAERRAQAAHDRRRDFRLSDRLAGKAQAETTKEVRSLFPRRFAPPAPRGRGPSKRKYDSGNLRILKRDLTTSQGIRNLELAKRLAGIDKNRFENPGAQQRIQESRLMKIFDPVANKEVYILKPENPEDLAILRAKSHELKQSVINSGRAAAEKIFELSRNQTGVDMALRNVRQTRSIVNKGLRFAGSANYDSDVMQGVQNQLQSGDVNIDGRMGASEIVELYGNRYRYPGRTDAPKKSKKSEKKKQEPGKKK